MHNTRTGNATGPRKVRPTAINSPSTAMMTPQTAMIRILSHSPSSTAGNDATALSHEK